jgi:peptidoglycan/LPS O-acetylase OafA/YrhL
LADVPAVTPARDDGRRIAVLDGLRGLAILLVVLTHSFLTGYRPAATLGPVSIGIEPTVLAGSLGVELFFFLSGFVLFAPYARATLERRPPPTLAHFLDRRFIKIVPSYYLAVLVTAFLFYVPPEIEQGRWSQIARHLAFVHPFWYDSMYGIVGAFWSLGVEVQFYVIFPALAALLRRWPVPTYAALLAAGEGFRLWLQATKRNGDFFWVCQLPAQIDLFALGMLCAYAYVAFGPRLHGRRVAALATAAAVAATVAGVWLLNDFSHVTKVGSVADHQAWQSDHRLVVSWTIAAIALGSLFAQRWWRVVVANPLLLWLSTISYNLYLWHEAIVTQCWKTGFPCAGIADAWKVDRHWDRDFFWTYLAVSVAVAAVVTYGLERPLLRLGTRGAFDLLVRGLLHRERGVAGRGRPEQQHRRDRQNE